MARSGIATLSACGLVLAGLLVTPAAAETIRNWPCEQPLAEHFVAEEVWGGALPAPLPGDWGADAAVREVVAFAANPENPPAQGAAAIEAFAGGLADGRTEALLAIYAGLLERFDLLRGFLIEGVRDFIVRAKILQEAVESNQRALAALPSDDGAAVEEQRRGYRAALAADERNLDDALEEAEFLCHRYGYLERKLQRLTSAIRSALAI